MSTAKPQASKLKDSSSSSMDADEKDEGVASPNEVAQERANDAATGLSGEGAQTGAAEGDEQAPLARFGFDILANIKAAQLQNGLRHGDYQRYRQYCSRRLRRIRVGLGFTHHKRDFKKKDIDASLVTDVRFLAMPLIQSERCWSYAMQLKNDMTPETQRKRVHLLKRLNKAATWAALLEQLCAARADTRTQLQAEAYASWLSGSVLFERNMHDKALAKFLHAKQVYDKLGSIGGSAVQILCEERVASLEDSIRFSKYCLRHAKGAAADDDEDETLGDLASSGNELLAAKLETLRQEKLLAQAQSLDTVEWQGKTVPVSNEKLRLCFVEANNLQKQLDKALESAPAAAASASAASDSSATKDAEQEPTSLSSLYSKLFGAYDEALKVLRDALLEPKMLEAHKAHLLALQQYATAGRLGVQVTRNGQFVRALVEQLHAQEVRPRDFVNRRKNKPDEAVVLYEKLIACLQELADLAATDKSPAGSALQRVYLARVQAAQSLRVFFLAESYRRIRKFLESYLLYGRALELADEFAKAAAKVPADAAADKALQQDAQRVTVTLRKEAAALRGQVHACALLEEAEKVARAAVPAASASGEKVKIGEGAKAIVVPSRAPALTLSARLDAWDSGDASSMHALLDFPPEFQAAPAKPILFDLAYNAIEYPDLSAKLKKIEAAKKAGSSSVSAAPAPAAAKAKPAAVAAAKKQPEPESEESEEEEEAAPAPAKAAKPAAAAASSSQPKKIAPPNESKADRARREQREREEEERRAAAAEAEAAKKKGWGLGGLVGKMFGR